MRFGLIYYFQQGEQLFLTRVNPAPFRCREEKKEKGQRERDELFYVPSRFWRILSFKENLWLLCF